jgi:hypothetical protein
VQEPPKIAAPVHGEVQATGPAGNRSRAKVELSVYRNELWRRDRLAEMGEPLPRAVLDAAVVQAAGRGGTIDGGR